MSRKILKYFVKLRGTAWLFSASPPAILIEKAEYVCRYVWVPYTDTPTERQASLSQTTNKKVATYSAALRHKQAPYDSENWYHKITSYFFHDVFCLYNQKKSFSLSLLVLFQALSKPSLTHCAVPSCGSALRAYKSGSLSKFKMMGAVLEQRDYCLCGQRSISF